MENSLQSLDAYEVTQVQHDQNIIQLDTIERANVDSQIATAKQYPRDLRRAINNSVAMATMDIPTAQSCGYALPRGGKPITGPSVHLAKLIVSNYGNIRAEAKVVQITDKQVISRGTCWDLENNVATAFEVRRSIVGRTGQRFSDDMITVTGNAANSIAYRNAVFSVIPRAITDKVYQAAQRCITGDLSDEDKIIARRKKCIDYFKDEFGITEQEVVMLCGKKTVNQIKANEIALLLGITQSLTDGDTTVDELMKPYRKEETRNTIAAAAAEAAKNAAAKKEDKKENKK
uniref:hypothetical protein n=1 Tax=Prevotella sp. TaxID=59823 RepID=UPI0040299851